MPIYVILGNWTDQGTRDFGGAVQRANGFRELVEQAGGRVRELVWTMGVRLHHRGGGTRRRDGRDAGVAGGGGRECAQQDHAGL